MSILERARRKLGSARGWRSMALAAVALAALAPVGAAPASAQERHWERDRDIHNFHERDLSVWRGGHWFHGPHLGRPGWWWVVNGVWYFYPTPVYPYPDPYAPPVVTAPPPAAPTTYYYCDNPAGYYPYVPQCPTPWRPVPAR